ncbi:hypothetical protein K402DRAFT_116370 [Aulographum hederae CBS 113979]|uniref:Uncharacterized protein n=1 Tax=Aulographum hederae CBS 113979 TaxID=1176131 RepID=A0A6G1GW91_9PEZI|nr:hypothetical protein K402DRAFT_116370 [Aulographum hederae CBS 113979]
MMRIVAVLRRIDPRPNNGNRAWSDRRINADEVQRNARFLFTDSPSRRVEREARWTVAVDGGRFTVDFVVRTEHAASGDRSSPPITFAAKGGSAKTFRNRRSSRWPVATANLANHRLRSLAGAKMSLASTHQAVRLALQDSSRIMHDRTGHRFCSV